jgi:glucose/arabinose dehydrogenase
MRLVTLALGMTLALTSLARGEEPLSPLPDLKLELVTVGLIQPVAIASPGDGSGRFFIAQQGGQLAFFDGSRVLSDLVLDLSSKVNCCFESGLLGLVPHPKFAENGYLFLAYTDRQDNVIVSRFHVSGDPPVADPASETVVLVVEQPSASHNGGQLLFGPDGLLYLSLGDGSGPSGEQNAQRLESLLGSILRIDVDHGEPYAIPGDNPFAGGVTSREEIWLYGLRNPWRFSFDRLTGDMFIADVGDRVAEEINFYPARSRGGANFGWASMEGSHCFSPSTNCEDPSFTPPIIEYEHRLAGCGGAVIGGYRYRGRKFPQLYGLYFFADYCAKEIYAASESSGEWTTLGGLATSLSISSFGEDENGEIYVVDHGLGHIFHITADVPAPQFSLISPGQAVAGTPGLTLALVGDNFVPGSAAYWNGELRPTQYLDKNRLLVSLPAEDIAAAGAAEVKVVWRR